MHLSLAASCAVFAATALAQNPAGNDLTFDGKDDSAVVPHVSSLDLAGDFTIEVWVKLPPKQDSTASTSGFVAKNMHQGNWSFNYYLGIRNAGSIPYFMIGDGNTTSRSWQEVRGKTSLGKNRWMHVAGVRSKTSLTLYVNGVPDVAPVRRTLNQGTNKQNIRIGSINGSINPKFFVAASMDEVRIWNVARTPQQIFRFHECSLDPKTPGLVAYWRFNETVADQRVLDATANNNHGFRGNTSSVGADDPTRSTSTLELGPLASKYGVTSGGNNTLDLDWLRTGSSSKGFVVASKAKANGTGMFFVSIGTSSIKLLGATILIDVSPNKLLPPLPFSYDTTGRWGFPLDLRTPGLSGAKVYGQVMENRSGALHLSNGLKMMFCQ